MIITRIKLHLKYKLVKIYKKMKKLIKNKNQDKNKKFKNKKN